MIGPGVLCFGGARYGPAGQDRVSQGQHSVLQGSAWFGTFGYGGFRRGTEGSGPARQGEVRTA